jgi:hypothetical protein
MSAASLNKEVQQSEEDKVEAVDQSQSTGENDCSICLETITEESLLLLPCAHKFHKACIVKQMTFGKNSQVCALCRVPLPSLTSLVPNYKEEFVSAFVYLFK